VPSRVPTIISDARIMASNEHGVDVTDLSEDGGGAAVGFGDDAEPVVGKRRWRLGGPGGSV
jgi:hypothetical protein